MATSNSTSSCFVSLDFDSYNITDLPDTVVPVWTTLAVVNGIAAPFIAMFNALIIWTVLGDHQLRSKAYNILLAALAVSDLIVGLIVDPLSCRFFVSLITEPETPCTLFEVYVSTMAISAGMTLCTLMMISVERYLAIQFPLLHLVHVTTKRVMAFAAALWITTPTFMLVFRVLVDNSQSLRLIPFIKFSFGNLLVILYCTIKVHITAYSKTKTTPNTLTTPQQTQQEQNEEKMRQLKEYKRAFTMGILVLTSVIFYFPFIIVSIIQAVSGKEVTQDFPFIAKQISATIILLQSLINPFIISLRMKKIRKSLKKKIMCCFNGH